MKQTPRSTPTSARTIRLAAGAVMSILLGGQAVSAKVIDETAHLAGMTLHYKVVLPKDYAPEKTYPAVLAFPPGAQTMDMVFTTLERNWAPEAQRRGYIVVIPAAPGGRLFIEDGARVFPAFLDKLLGDYNIRDRKFYIAGMSNGGLSAFHIAASYPQYFLAVTGFPGYLPDATPERVSALRGLCINRGRARHGLAEHGDPGRRISRQGVRGSHHRGKGAEPRDRHADRRRFGSAVSRD
jgi:poly(3-hydroxybutyrate) depolymerase